MLHQILSAPLPNGRDGATNTLPRASDNVLWLAIMSIAGCVVGGKPIGAALDSATQLITVIVVLILVRACITPRHAVSCRSRQVGG
ncbi:hypothetical protein [Streptomyces incarnatus]|uniref:hypothetical protein n=1 Tax=Streptomyces incarnatus TaxID=665007 RepID=UPI000A6B2F26|nr:hypothetical protein [Streptomyces incarnatus]